MTSFCEEVRRGQVQAARTRLIAKMESDEKLRRIWGTEKIMLSMKILMCLIGLVYLLQFAISGIHGGTVFSNVMGNAIFLPCICIFGVGLAFMTQVDQCTWKLVAGMLFHCMCSAATSAYVFLFFFTVVGIRNLHDVPQNTFTNAATFVWGLLCLIYITISFIFLSYTYASIHDLFSKFFVPQIDINFHEVCRVEGTEGGRIFIRDTKFLRGSSGYNYELI